MNKKLLNGLAGSTLIVMLILSIALPLNFCKSSTIKMKYKDLMPYLQSHKQSIGNGEDFSQDPTQGRNPQAIDFMCKNVNQQSLINGMIYRIYYAFYTKTEPTEYQEGVEIFIKGNFVSFSVSINGETWGDGMEARNNLDDTFYVRDEKMDSGLNLYGEAVWLSSNQQIYGISGIVFSLDFSPTTNSLLFLWPEDFNATFYDANWD